jgi:hypothetical protein
VAAAVVEAAAARRPVTRSVPRLAAAVRLARLAPVGALLDVVFGRFGRAVASRVDALVEQQASPRR